MYSGSFRDKWILCFTLRPCLLDAFRITLDSLDSCICLLCPNLKRTGTFESMVLSSVNKKPENNCCVWE